MLISGLHNTQKERERESKPFQVIHLNKSFLIYTYKYTYVSLYKKYDIHFTN